jgi:hypothetical protein
MLALLAVCCGATAARAQGQPDPAKAPGAAEKATVEVYFAAEHVPAGLKAGAAVDLKVVNGKTVSPTGKVAYATTTLAPDAEVASVTPVEKPQTPERAVRVELRVTDGQAAAIERAKARLVTVAQTTPGGRMTTEKRPVTFRLEPSQPATK